MIDNLSQRLFIAALQPQRRLDLEGTLHEKAVTAATTYILLGLTGYLSIYLPVPTSLNADIISLVSIIAIVSGLIFYLIRHNFPTILALTHTLFAIALITIALWAGQTTQTASISMTYLLAMLLIFHFYNVIVSIFYILIIIISFSSVAIHLEWAGWQSLLVLLVGSCITSGILIKLLTNRIHHLASTDKLTGAYNRHTWDTLFKHELNYAQRNNKPLYLMIIDLDKFKVINDTLGHLEGDRILKLTANAIRKSLRSSDIFARWGGDEFVIALHDCDEKEAKKMEQRLLTQMNGIIGFSVGSTPFKTHDTADSIMLRADNELYQQKQNRSPT